MRKLPGKVQPATTGRYPEKIYPVLYHGRHPHDTRHDDLYLPDHPLEISSFSRLRSFLPDERNSLVAKPFSLDKPPGAPHDRNVLYQWLVCKQIVWPSYPKTAGIAAGNGRRVSIFPKKTMRILLAVSFLFLT